ncbi:hypothetical protein G7046_g9911 [Stylonectria norvegica]|nr:hypothetical protein G7046_g9911 [Stylonectria norvegica]
MASRSHMSNSQYQTPLSSNLVDSRWTTDGSNDYRDYLRSAQSSSSHYHNNPLHILNGPPLHTSKAFVDGNAERADHLGVGPLSAYASAESLDGGESTQSDSQNTDFLLELCEAVRTHLATRKDLGPRWEEVMGFLGAVLKDEHAGMPLLQEHSKVPMLEFATIESARLDKLLADILDPDKHPSPMPSRFRIDLDLAESLQRHWRRRFREAFFTIDQNRAKRLSTTGRLKDVVFTNDPKNPRALWKTKTCEELSEVEGNLQFEPGHWWLNLACAYRDGIVGSLYETPTKGKYGAAALPLVTGREEVYFPDGTVVKYVREGRLADMHVSLISQVGSQMRILRGHCLQSPLAPKAGVRYDGLYIIRQYGHKRNPQTELHRVILTLERVEGQCPMEEIVQIPRPSQLDDWLLFEKYEGEMVKQRRGDQGFLEWKIEKGQERIDKEQYKRALAFHASVQVTKLDKKTVAAGQEFVKKIMPN